MRPLCLRIRGLPEGSKQPNDADRLRKYLARSGVEWGGWLHPQDDA
jgi:sigma54-dependent transcription regulator